MLVSKERWEEVNRENSALKLKLSGVELEAKNLLRTLRVKLHKAEADPAIENVRSLFVDEIEEMEPLLKILAIGTSTHKHCATTSLSLIETIREQVGREEKV